jgi:hypothetical protein
LSFLSSGSSAVWGIYLFSALTRRDESGSDLLQGGLLLATNLGSLLALFRSARTRAETGATLTELTSLRMQVLSTPLVEATLSVWEAATVDELTRALHRMVRLVVNLPLRPDRVNRASLWCLDSEGTHWIVCASSGQRPQDFEFKLPVLPSGTKPLDGAGIIPNFAIASAPTRDGCWANESVFLCTRNVSKHPWYRDNPYSDRVAHGLVVVLLKDGEEIVGALSLTSHVPNEIPIDGSARDELVDILMLWAQSFLVAPRRLDDLEQGTDEDQSTHAG